MESAADGFDLVIVISPPPDYVSDDGLRAIKKVRPGLPIILTVGYGVDIEGTLATQMGVDAVIREPIIFGELAELLWKLLDQEEKEAINSNKSAK